MGNRIVTRRPKCLGVATLGLLMCIPRNAESQFGPEPPPARPVDAKTAAPYDITGYWVSVVTEDWRWRMVTPAKGDYASVPLTAEGRKVTDAWDPAKDEAEGAQCKAYGAPAIMRVPGRIHVTWVDANTMKIDADAGSQVRTLHFGEWKTSGGEPQWQGDSIASWDEMIPSRGGLALVPPSREIGGQKRGTLKVITTHMRPGYLRKNGAPYSANAVVTEYYDLSREASGDTWLWITTVVNDPQYLTQPFITSTHWKKQPDASGWNPTPCAAR